MGIQAQIFLGILQTSEVRMYLRQSLNWQTDFLDGKTLLKEANWDQKLYLGYYLSSQLNYTEIEQNEKKIKSELQNYCPKLNLDQNSLFLLPQIFIS